MDWKDKIVKEFKTHLVSNSNGTISETTLESAENWIRDALAEGYSKGYWTCYDEMEEAMELEEATEAHKTELGYCCACSYDLSCMESRVKDTRDRIIEKIKDYQDCCQRVLNHLNIRGSAGDISFGRVSACKEILKRI